MFFFSILTLNYTTKMVNNIRNVTPWKQCIIFCNRDFFLPYIRDSQPLDSRNTCVCARVYTNDVYTFL